MGKQKAIINITGSWIQAWLVSLAHKPSTMFSPKQQPITTTDPRKNPKESWMTTKMVPNTNYSEDYDTSSSSSQQRRQEEEGQHGSVNEDSTEDYELYNYPENVTPQYRSIPLLVEGIVLAISYVLPMALRRSKMMIFSSNSKKSQAKMVCWWLAQLALSWWTCRTIVQDALYSPSRIAQPWKHLKPCSLSRHSTISTATLPSFASKLKQPQQDATIPLDPLGVHYIQYDNDNNNNKDDVDDVDDLSSNNNNNNNVWFDAVHCNHGFGASSLSWLPALPSLTKIAKAPFGLAHDCVGFGLTERPLPTARQLTRNPNLLLPYTSLGTASIGNQLLLLQQQAPKENKSKPLESIVLLGHSMGTVATLQMALHFLPRETKKLIILVAPALITSSKQQQQQQSKQLQSNATSTKIQKVLSYIIQSQPTQTLKLIVQLFYSFLRSVIFDAPLSYALKRIGSNKKFWKNGLSVAWGDKSLLKSSDILRFEWPSVCQNWIPGILNFARSRLFYQTNQDLILLQQVVELPHTQVVIVHGTKDAVIPLSSSQTIVQHIKLQKKQKQQSPIDLVLLEGRGHDPFEENMDEFSQCFQTIVHKFQQTYMNNNNNMSSNQSSE